MGADLLVSFLSAGLKREIDFDAGERAIERLGRRSLDEWPDALLVEEGIDPDDASEEEREALVERLKADLAVLNDAVQGHRRDVWLDEIGRKRIVLSGGMSWGDSPTEAFDAIWRLSAAGITRAMGFDQ